MFAAQRPRGLVLQNPRSPTAVLPATLLLLTPKVQAGRVLAALIPPLFLARLRRLVKCMS